METNAYQQLAHHLDTLPNGFPPTSDGAELRLLAKLFTPEEAELASLLRLTPETCQQIVTRSGRKTSEIFKLLKAMSRSGLIRVERQKGGLAFSNLPFVVGIYENQGWKMDAELAQLFEDYYLQAFGETLTVQPAFHRVIPVGESVRVDLEIQPYESVEAILTNAQSWGVLDCICRKQQALIGKPCPHPIDNCMAFSSHPGAFKGDETIRSLTIEQARDVLRRAAEAGLVHSVSNSQQGVTYICNCCTCACGILRGLVEFGIANVVARSDYVNEVDTVLCTACGLCVDSCQFSALSVLEFAQVERARCAGCGVCVHACPEGALGLVLRPADEIKPPPATHHDWMSQRAAARGLDINQVI